MTTPGRAQHREAALDAEPGVGGSCRQRLAIPDADLDLEIRRRAVILRDGGEIGGDDGARPRIDRRLADRERQAGERDRADAGAGQEADARTGRGRAHARAHQRAMRGVRVVAGVLLHADPLAGLGEREGGAEPARQRDRHRVRQASGQQAFARRPRRRRRAGPRGPASSQCRHAGGSIASNVMARPAASAPQRRSSAPPAD